MGKLRLISCRQLSERQCFRNARIQVTIAFEITSWLSTVAPTSQLEAPSKTQRVNDFPGNRKTASIDPTYSEENFEGID
jgi:hypothetical protein